MSDQLPTGGCPKSTVNSFAGQMLFTTEHGGYQGAFVILIGPDQSGSHNNR